MEARVRSALLGALGAALAACGSTAPQPDAPQRPGLPAFWESQVTEESEPQAPEAPQTPQAPGATPEPGTYFENWPDVSGAGAAGTEEAPPFRVGPTPAPAGPDAQRPQQLIESDTPAGPPY